MERGPEDEKVKKQTKSKKEKKEKEELKDVPLRRRQPRRNAKKELLHRYSSESENEGMEADTEDEELRSTRKEKVKEKEEPISEKPSGKVGLKYVVDEEQVKKQTEKDLKLKELHRRAQKLKQTFINVFPEDEWVYKLDKEKGITTYTNKSGQTITIQEEKEDLKFSGEPLKKLVDATKAYEKEYKVEGMTYEVEAESLEDAKAFMKDLYANGFDLNKITAIQSEKNEKFDLETVKKEIVKSMEEKMEKRKGKSPKPHKGSEED